MKFKLLLAGKTDERYLREGSEMYAGRLAHYIKLDIFSLPSVKETNPVRQREMEAVRFMKNIDPSDFVVLLDEHGSRMSSVEFAGFIRKKSMGGTRCIVFVTGGPFGHGEAVRQRADFELSLSPMTFSHQMVRLFFLEQLYRAMTIIKGEKYHHG